MVNKSELIRQAAAKANLTSAQMEIALKALLETIIEDVAAGDRVQLTGFGTFLPKKQEGGTVRHIKTGESVNIPSKTIPGFRPGPVFKNALKK